MTKEPSNPYRLPRPKDRDCIAGGKFYLLSDDGRHRANMTAAKLAVCSEYIWVNDLLSIPLTAINNLGRSEKSGFIDYWDALAGKELRFYFTKIGFLRFDRKGLDRFLEILRANLPTQTQQTQQTHEKVAGQELARQEEFRCERCESNDVGVYTFEVYRFVGITPFVYAKSITPFRYVLCAEHARGQAIRCCTKTALLGYFGFVGCVEAPWYVCKNLWFLRGVGVADRRTSVTCILGCVIVPYILIVAPIVWYVYS